MTDSIPIPVQGLEGFDASHFNGIANMGSVRTADKKFAILKATDGLTFTDPTFSSKIHAAIGSGLVPGAYHFLRPTEDPRAQARFFAETIRAWAPLIPVIDIEWALDQKTQIEGWGTLTYVQASNVVLFFLQEFGFYFKGFPHIYGPKSFWDQFLSGLDLSAYPLMAPDYGTVPPATPKIPPFWKKCSIHQYTEKGSVPGIVGPVDLDYFSGSLDDLKSLVCVPV